MLERTVKIEPCRKSDFDWILEHFGEFWDDEATRPRHHPIFVHEFGDSAFAIRDRRGIGAYLFGVVASSGAVGYVHLVAARRDRRREGLARALYERFVEHALAAGCRRLKATCNPANRPSIAFHRSLGMEMETVRDYAGPGIDRVVFTRDLAV